MSAATTANGATPVRRRVVPAKSRPWPSAAERARALGGDGKMLPTGFATLDGLLRGGLRHGRLMIAAAAPGVGKTGLAAHLAGLWADAGIPVIFVAGDEGAESILVREGQNRLGLSREALERGEPEARDALAAWFVEHPSFELVDPDEDDRSLADVIESWEEMIGDRTGVVIVDSIQSLARRPTEADEATSSVRAQVDAVIATLRTVASSGHIVIALSEVGRFFYRAARAGEKVDALSAPKESGGAEYSADVLLVLRSVEGSYDLVDVIVAKNRLGRRGEFQIRRDEDRCSFADVGSGTSEIDSKVEEAKAAHRLQAIREGVLRAVKKHACGSKSDITAWVEGRRADVLATISELIASGSLARSKGVFVAVPDGGKAK